MSLTPESSVLAEVLQEAIAGHVQAMALITDQLTESNGRCEELTRDLAVAHQMIEHLKTAGPQPAAPAPGETAAPAAVDSQATLEALATERAARLALEARFEELLARPPATAVVGKGRYEATIVERDGNGDGRRFIILKK